jgi:hypothetical protein
MRRRQLRYGGRSAYVAARCAVCYRRLWPLQRKTAGANYFRHPYMICHLACGLAEEARLTQDYPHVSG